MFDPTVLNVERAKDIGPMLTTEIDHISFALGHVIECDGSQCHPVDHTDDVILVLRFLYTIDLDPNARDYAMLHYRDVDFWTAVAVLTNDFQTFKKVPNAVLAYLLYADGNYEGARKLVNLILNMDNTYNLALLLLAGLESGAPSAMASSGLDVIDKERLVIAAEHDQRVMNWRKEESAYWKNNSES